MNEFESSADAIHELEQSIASFSYATHDPESHNSAWYAVFLAARSTACTFQAEAILDGHFYPTIREKVIALLNKAEEIIPSDVNLRLQKGKHDYHKQIKGWLEEVINLPTTLLDTEDNE